MSHLGVPAMPKNFVFTWNNYTEESEKRLKDWPTAVYGVYGREVAPETGTPHLQGYLELKDSVSWDKINKKFPGVYTSERKGTQAQAIAYCKKDGDFVEWGTPKSQNQGKRTDLEGVADMVKSGASLKRVAEEYPTAYIKFYKGIWALKSILLSPRDEVPKVTVLYGATCTGKSKKARELTGPDRYVWHPQNGHWFEDYQGEKDVIFEEFRGQLPFGMILSLLDRYDCRVQYKGGSIQFCGTNIVITSPIHPQDWYKKDDLRGDEKLDQLLRRITDIQCLDVYPIFKSKFLEV